MARRPTATTHPPRRARRRRPPQSGRGAAKRRRAARPRIAAELRGILRFQRRSGAAIRNVGLSNASEPSFVFKA